MVYHKFFSFFLYGLLVTFPLSIIQAQVKLGDNITQINPNALLELESVERGVLLSRMTESQRDNAFRANIPNGLIIYNTTRQCLQIWNVVSGTWECLLATSMPDGRLALTISDDNLLSIEGGGFVDLSAYVNTDNQQLSLSGFVLSLDNGGSVNLSTLASGGGVPPTRIIKVSL